MRLVIAIAAAMLLAGCALGLPDTSPPELPAKSADQTQPTAER